MPGTLFSNRLKSVDQTDHLEEGKENFFVGAEHTDYSTVKKRRLDLTSLDHAKISSRSRAVIYGKFFENSDFNEVKYSNTNAESPRPSLNMDLESQLVTHP